MVKYVRICKGIDGYNPPYLYKQFRNANDASNFYNARTVANLTCKHSVTNNLGRIIIETNSISNTEFSVVKVWDDDSKFVFIGNVLTVRNVTPNEIEITYEIDWYTSQIVSHYFEGSIGYALPIADSAIYRRRTGGEFDYIDDGFTPKKIVTTISSIGFTRESDQTFIDMFSRTLSSTNFVLCYHDSAHNNTFWLSSQYVSFGNVSFNPEFIWYNFIFGMYQSAGANLTNLTVVADIYQKYAFNPENVIFFGFNNVTGAYYSAFSIHSCNWANVHDDIRKELGVEQGTLVNSVQCLNGFKFKNRSNISDGIAQTDDYSRTIQTKIDINKTPKESEEYSIVDVDGNEIFKFVNGVKYTTINVETSFNFNPSLPSLTFTILDSDYVTNGQKTFSVGLKPITYFVDSEAVYRATERVYNSEMRTTQTVNKLISGVTGSVATGTMIYGFSRSGNSPYDAVGHERWGLKGWQKGLIGGGVGVATAGASAVIEDAYINPKIQSIEDKQARVKADSLLISGAFNPNIIANAGLMCNSYDTETKNNIDKYQSRYGTKTNLVETNIRLNNFVINNCYIQADIVLQAGLRKEIETYIIKMFSNGVYFTYV